MLMYRAQSLWRLSYLSPPRPPGLEQETPLKCDVTPCKKSTVRHYLVVTVCVITDGFSYLRSALLTMKKLLFACLLITGTFAFSCKKEALPPTMSLKTGSGYTSADVIVAPGTMITVGVIADQGTDSLNLVYTEVAYDGANVDSLYERYWVPNSATHVDHDFTFQVRNQVGSERWTFNVNDNDGRLIEKEIRIVVQ